MIPSAWILLHKGGVILDVETDVVEHASAGRRLRGVSLGKAELYARQGRRSCALFPVPALPPNVFGVPGLGFRDPVFRQEEMDMLVLDRDRLRLVFQNLDTHAVGGLDESLI